MQTHVIEAAERAHARFTARGRRHAALSVISLITGLGLLVYIARQYRERARRLDAEAVAREMAVANARLEKASAAKSVFLANMSHEIRTPLNAILGMATVLQRDNLSQKQRERVGIISSSGQSLLSVLNDILDLSKVEAGKLDLEIVEFDLEQLVRSVESTFAHKAQGKGLAFTVTLDDTASGRFCGDPARIRQVLNNLVSNALKFTESGGVRVTAKALSTPDDATVMLEFAVADTGPGLSPSAIERVFSPFTQADETIARTHGGTGLGLAISKQLCALMGGDIWVQSVESQGATFRFTVAVERALTPASAALADDAFWPAPEKACDKKEPLRVLAAEDNRGNRQVLAALLEPLRSDLTFAENGRQAVTMWSNGAYDVILMDVEMPVMNGVDATREIRRVEAATGRARTPIVALTANAMRHQAQQYREAGMDRVVSKPLQLNELIEALVSLADDAPPSAARQEGRA